MLAARKSFTLDLRAIFLRPQAAIATLSGRDGRILQPPVERPLRPRRRQDRGRHKHDPHDDLAQSISNSIRVCTLIALAIVIILGVAFFASIATFWPYNLTPSFKNYDFDMMDGGGWASYYNSLQLAVLTALFGTGDRLQSAPTWSRRPRVSRRRAASSSSWRCCRLPFPAWCSASATSSSSIAPSIRWASSTAPWPSWCLHGRRTFTRSRTRPLSPRSKQIDQEFETVSASLRAVLAYLHAGDPAGLPAGRAGHRHVPVRQRDDDRIRRRVPLLAAYDAGGDRRAGHG